MAGYSFADRAHVVALIKMLEQTALEFTNRGYGSVSIPAAVPRPDLLTQGFIYKTPQQGIPGRVQDEPGKADCVPHFINPVSGKLEEIKRDDGSELTHEVFNIFQGDIGGDRYIFVDSHYTVLVATAEDCS
jgi:hypothetical protein